MKLATYDDGSRDGQLVIVSRDLAMACYASPAASRLQPVLDDWNFLAPQLEALSSALNQGRARHAFEFDPARCLAPLPRAFRWLDHFAAAAPVARAGDTLRGALQPERAGVAATHVGLAAVSGDVARGTGTAEAIDGVRLLLCVLATAAEAVSGDDEAAAPESLLRCASVAITPDELGESWRSGVAQLAVLAGAANGRRAAAPAPVRWPGTRHFGTLLSRAAQGLPVGAGGVMAWYRPWRELVEGEPSALRVCDAEGRDLFGPLPLVAPRPSVPAAVGAPPADAEPAPAPAPAPAHAPSD